MENDTKRILKDESFHFNNLVCGRSCVSLNTADFLRWLFLEPARANSDVVKKFGMGTAWHALQYGHVENPLDDSDVPHWSLTTDGVNLLTELCSESLGNYHVQGISSRHTSTQMTRDEAAYYKK